LSLLLDGTNSNQAYGNQQNRCLKISNDTGLLFPARRMLWTIQSLVQPDCSGWIKLPNQPASA
jgi:hypothetical protein